MPERHQKPDPAELAALYAAGALSPDETAAFEAELAKPGSSYAEALRDMSPAIEGLAGCAGSVEPPTTVLDSLKQRINQAQAAPFFIQREDRSDWDDIGIPGARMRMLYLDRKRMIKTFLLEMEAGCEVPSHPHNDVEECYIISGDLHTADTVLGPGDYMRADAGTLHGRSFTKTGCVMLVIAGVDEHELN